MVVDEDDDYYDDYYDDYPLVLDAPKKRKKRRKNPEPESDFDMKQVLGILLVGGAGYCVWYQNKYRRWPWSNWSLGRGRVRRLAPARRIGQPLRMPVRAVSRIANPRSVGYSSAGRTLNANRTFYDNLPRLI